MYNIKRINSYENKSIFERRNTIMSVEGPHEKSQIDNLPDIKLDFQDLCRKYFYFSFHPQNFSI